MCLNDKHVFFSYQEYIELYKLNLNLRFSWKEFRLSLVEYRSTFNASKETKLFTQKYRRQTSHRRF